MFSKESRYAGLGQRTHRLPDGREVVYVERRVVPREPKGIEGQVVVGPEERHDLVADRTLGRSEAAWRLCDANRVLNPFEIITGRTLDVPEL